MTRVSSVGAGEHLCVKFQSNPLLQRYKIIDYQRLSKKLCSHPQLSDIDILSWLAGLYSDGQGTFWRQVKMQKVANYL